ncbi:hypothetical protein QR680_013451 [Steinernema hermaphroditum]|uniref:Uncharacterized protein n=1 Tax=Steinernema hermaphroditum TaxID=289476 RepID=A0AA39I8C3_9BILA|nr:hypothetical protein QR680_013451 [Steinernema hermaphroditum]
MNSKLFLLLFLGASAIGQFVYETPVATPFVGYNAYVLGYYNYLSYPLYGAPYAVGSRPPTAYSMPTEPRSPSYGYYPYLGAPRASGGNDRRKQGSCENSENRKNDRFVKEIRIYSGV